MSWDQPSSPVLRQASLVRLFPGLADAAGGSLATFLVGLYAARYLDINDIGVFAVFFTAFMVAGVIPAELVLVPHEVRCVTVVPARRLRFLRFSLGRGLATGIVAVAVVVPLTALAIDAASATVIPMAATAAMASVLSPLQDHIRRMAHYADASWVAAATSTVQLLAVGVGLVVLHVSLLPRAWIPYSALAAGNVVSGCMGAILCRFRPGLGDRVVRPSLAGIVRDGRWLLMAGMAPMLAGLFVNVAVSRLADLSTVGRAEAARLVAQPILVLGMGLLGVFGPRLLEARRFGDDRTALRVRGRYLLVLGVICPLYLAIVGPHTAWNPAANLIPAAYEAVGLPAIYVLATFTFTAVTALRHELTGAGLIPPFARIEVSAGALRVTSTLAAIPLGPYAIPLGILLASSVSGLAQHTRLRRR